MEKNMRKLGFVYFKSPEYYIKKQLDAWLPALKQLGALSVIFTAGFDRSIPEDVFIVAEENELDPIVHFNSELPIARKFNDVVLILDSYARWGVRHIILGDKPNTKASWQEAGWHYENLVDHFLDRFIPLANYAVRIGLKPVLPPMQPGGDYWDTAFLELIAKGLKRRKLDDIISQLVLSSYGYTFNQPLSWGKGGPERWSVSKPYITPEGQEDQLGFHNFEWVQAYVQRQIGKELPVMVLDVGNQGGDVEDCNQAKIKKNMQSLFGELRHETTLVSENLNSVVGFEDKILGCFYDMDTLDSILEEPLSFQVLKSNIFNLTKNQSKVIPDEEQRKSISNYLLLPSYQAGVSDAVLNKVRPIIKKFKPTIGFSVNEALMAQKVMVYPDATIFNDEQLNLLRAAGCTVEILPESGIEIATYLQE
jgi:hypothetical protein